MRVNRNVGLCDSQEMFTTSVWKKHNLQRHLKYRSPWTMTYPPNINNNAIYSDLYVSGHRVCIGWNIIMHTTTQTGQVIKTYIKSEATPSGI